MMGTSTMARGSPSLPLLQASFNTLELDGWRISDAWFPPQLFLPRHAHDTAVFAVSLEGSMEIQLAARTYACTPATVQVHPAGETHAQRYARGGARLLVVEPAPERVEQLGPQFGWLGQVCNFPHAPISDLARRTRRELCRRDAVTPIAVEALVLEMLAMAARLGAAERTRSIPPRWLVRAGELVHERFRSHLRIADIGTAVGMHPVHVARAFRERYHVPLGTYIRRLRLEWAARRLVDSGQPLADIALEAGFADQSHFTRSFRCMTGVTPQRYRETRRAAIAR